jgi:hypothetical protein
VAVLSLPEAKAHLNIAGSQDDAELQQTIDEAESAIEGRVGPLSATSKTSRVRGCSDTLLLPSAPVSALTSVTPVGGTVLSLSAVYLDPSSGVVSCTPSGTFSSPWYDVVYQVGSATVPDGLLRAVKEMTAHLWATQRGGTVRPSRGGGESASNTLPGAAYAFPYRVEQLIAPYESIGLA